MKKQWIVLLATSRIVLMTTAGLLIIAGLMFYRLSSLTPGLSQVELDTYQSASSINEITGNMVNAPYKAAVFISTSLFDSAFGLRLVGALLGVLSVVIFYLLVKRILGSIISLAATAMYASSTLLLNTTRLATPNVMLLTLLAIIGAGFYLRFGKRPEIGWLLTAIVVGLSLYVPGMIIFIIPAAAWQFRHVKKSFESLRTPYIIAASAIFGALCVPLIVSLIREPSLWRAYVGFGNEFAPFMEMAKSAGSAISSLFVVSEYDPVFWLGRQPVLDVFASVMFIYGLTYLVRNYKLDRLWTITGILILGLLWTAVTTNRHGIVILLPFIYTVVGLGIQQFINQWFSVFPKNPIARTTGALLLAIAICLSLNFQLHRYFTAWPNNEETRQIFNRTLN